MPRVSSAPPAPDKPNVILITLDTVRADHLSLYGYGRDTTPNLKKLSEVGTVYTNAIAPEDMTLSSHASIFTGLYPSQHRAHFDSEPSGVGPWIQNMKRFRKSCPTKGSKQLGLLQTISTLPLDLALIAVFLSRFIRRSPLVRSDQTIPAKGTDSQFPDSVF